MSLKTTILGVLLVLCSFLATTVRAADHPATMLPAGEPAPAFALVGSTGDEHRLENYRGIGIAIAFLPGHDPASLRQLRSLNKEICEFDTMGVKVFVITPMSVETAHELHSREGFDFAILSDPDGKVAEAYGIPGQPDGRGAYVIGPDGKIMLPIREFQGDQFGSQMVDLTAACLDTHPQPPSRYIGKKVANFTLPTARDRQPVSLYGTGTQKATVVLFVSSHCPCSRRYDERIRTLSDLYMKRGVRFLAINSAHDETSSQAAGHAWKALFDFPMLKDRDNVIADRLGAHTTPEVFLLDKNGILRYHGRFDDNRNPIRVTSNDLRSALDAVLSGKNPVKADRTSFGCAISRVPGRATAATASTPGGTR
ncbi:MAG: redoxin domain-containing protein [Capsulimonadales bacterium]|nr:redoxin domain-containing protein [Capsulimonadales bacterium]